MNPVTRLCFYLLCCSFLCVCNVEAAEYVAGHEVAREEVLRAIPRQYIDAARTTLHIAYQHTSHGTHVTRGMLGLASYKNGDDVTFGIKFTSSGRPTAFSGTAGDGRLDFHDYAINRWPYNDNIPASSDLSYNESAFVQLTRNFLDDPANGDINVVMWSWCNIAGHDVAANYLPGMRTLIDEYGPGGEKILSGERAVPVTFVFMTGHANGNDNIGAGKPADQAGLITDYCRQNGYFCLDYYSIDTHDMEGNYWPDAGDDGNSSAGGDFYRRWQDDHSLGEEWFENRSIEDGSHAYGEHTTQDITANRKAYAMWWILARIAGWDPDDDKTDRDDQSPEENENDNGQGNGRENPTPDTENGGITAVGIPILRLTRHIYTCAWK